MPALLTVDSMMMCPHGGMVAGIPGSARVAAGSPVLRVSDTFLIAGCPFVIGIVPSPCVSAMWVVGALRVMAEGVPALNDASVGLCLAATQVPQGMVLVVSAQPEVSGL